MEEGTPPPLRVVPAAPSPPVDSNGRVVDLATVPPSFAASEASCRGATTISPAPSDHRGAPPTSGAADPAADPAVSVGDEKPASRVGNVASRGGGARTVVVTDDKFATDGTTGTMGAAASSRGCNTAAAVTAVTAIEGVADGGGTASPPPAAATVSVDADTSMAVDAVDAGVLPTPIVAADRGAEDVDPDAVEGAVEGAAFSEGGPGGRDTFGRGAARLEEAVCDDDGAERLSLSLDLETLPLPCLSGHSTWQHERALFRRGKGSGR